MNIVYIEINHWNKFIYILTYMEVKITTCCLIQEIELPSILWYLTMFNRIIQLLVIVVTLDKDY